MVIQIRGDGHRLLASFGYHPDDSQDGGDWLDSNGIRYSWHDVQMIRIPAVIEENI
jgi:hypothetical protein